MAAPRATRIPVTGTWLRHVPAAAGQHARYRARGVGKTVLLKVLANRAQAADWEPAFMELQPAHNTDAAIRWALGSLLERTRGRLSRRERLRAVAGKALRTGSLSISWEGFGSTWRCAVMPMPPPGSTARRSNQTRGRAVSCSR